VWVKVKGERSNPLWKLAARKAEGEQHWDTTHTQLSFMYRVHERCGKWSEIYGDEEKRTRRTRKRGLDAIKADNQIWLAWLLL